MKFLSGDEAFSFEALRVTGYAPYGGADLGHRCWKQAAERLHAAGAEALRAGRVTSAGLAARRGDDPEAGP